MSVKATALISPRIERAVRPGDEKAQRTGLAIGEHAPPLPPSADRYPRHRFTGQFLDLAEAIRPIELTARDGILGAGVVKEPAHRPGRSMSANNAFGHKSCRYPVTAPTVRQAMAPMNITKP
ncbi:MAG: hypothetical protein ABI471_00075 [Sphingomonas bacterium]